MKHLGIALAFLVAAPAAAQQTDLGEPLPEGGEVEIIEQSDGGLSFTVTDESAWENLGIAIPAFATDRNVPTPANQSGTAALGLELARVVTCLLYTSPSPRDS